MTTKQYFKLMLLAEYLSGIIFGICIAIILLI